MKEFIKDILKNTVYYTISILILYLINNNYFYFLLTSFYLLINTNILNIYFGKFVFLIKVLLLYLIFIIRYIDMDIFNVFNILYLLNVLTLLKKLNKFGLIRLNNSSYYEIFKLVLSSNIYITLFFQYLFYTEINDILYLLPLIISHLFLFLEKEVWLISYILSIFLINS